MVKQSKSSPSQEYLEKEKIINLDLTVATEKHKMKMEEFMYLRESDRLHHERDLERCRVKTAEIRKSQMRKFSDPYKH